MKGNSFTFSQNNVNKPISDFLTQKKPNVNKIPITDHSDLNESSTYSSSPDINKKDKLLLNVHIKLENGVKIINFNKNDNTILVSERFCKQNKLNFNLVIPIAEIINNAIDSLDMILNRTNFDESNLEEIRDIYKEIFDTDVCNKTSICEIIKDLNIQREEILNKTI